MKFDHLLAIEDLNKEQLVHLIDNSKKLIEVSERDIKKVPALRGRTIINLFMEASTRTRSSFELAGKRLSADVINVSGDSTSVKKGETLLDTARTLNQMCPDILVVRHKSSGAAHFLANHLEGVSVINAGDGMHEHPTQGLLDCLSLKCKLEETGKSIEGLTLAIVGDVRHSRVARSNIWAHKLLGNKVRLIGPRTLVPNNFVKNCFGNDDFISTHTSLEEGLEGADVVMCIRLQLERQSEFFIPSLQEYTNEYFVTEKLISELAPSALLMTPGPINRGVEVESALIDGPRSLMKNQVKMGIATRMAVMLSLISSGENNEDIN